MLLTAADRAVDRPGWSAELKWDGYRGICYSAASYRATRVT
jgi:ATP-dependent DNA ligase